MTSDEIMQVLRLTAMGRVNTPMQQQFCEALEKALQQANGVPVDAIPVVTDEEIKAKRARKTKAE